MQIYVMDNDYETLKKLDYFINRDANRTAKCFTNIKRLVDAVRTEQPDAVWIDLDTVYNRSAVDAIKHDSPLSKIVMLTMDYNRTNALFDLGLDGYLFKPLDDAKIEEQLFRLQHPLLAKIKYKKVKA